MHPSTAFSKALNLLLTLDESLLEIIFLSLEVSGIAIILATLAGLAIALALDLFSFPGKGLSITILNTLTGLPPVVVGLGLYLLLSRQGPLGFLDLLYTPSAMVLAQFILAVPLVAAISHGALNIAGATVKVTALGLGATGIQASLAALKDSRYSVTAAIATAFGRVVSEVGAVLVVGGNIAHYTRVMTTAIALEADKGDFELAIALGIVLLLLSFAVNIFLYAVQQRGVKK